MRSSWKPTWHTPGENTTSVLYANAPLLVSKRLAQLCLQLRIDLRL